MADILSRDGPAIHGLCLGLNNVISASVDSTGMCDIEDRPMWQLLTVTLCSATRVIIRHSNALKSVCLSVCLSAKYRLTRSRQRGAGHSGADRPGSRPPKQPLTCPMSISVGVIAFKRQLHGNSRRPSYTINQNRDLTKNQHQLFDCVVLEFLSFRRLYY